MGNTPPHQPHDPNILIQQLSTKLNCPPIYSHIVLTYFTQYTTHCNTKAWFSMYTNITQMLCDLVTCIDGELLNSPIGFHNDTIFTLASTNGHLLLCDTLLLRNDLNIHHANVYGMNGFTLAIARGHVELVKRYITVAGMIRGYAGLTAAIEHGQTECLDVILPFYDLSGETDRPIITALQYFRWDCVQSLIAAGAPIQAKEQHEIDHAPIYMKPAIERARQAGQTIRDIVLRQIPPLVVDATGLPPIMAQIVLEYYSTISRELRLKEHPIHAIDMTEEEQNASSATADIPSNIPSTTTSAESSQIIPHPFINCPLVQPAPPPSYNVDESIFMSDDESQQHKNGQEEAKVQECEHECDD